MPGDTLEKLEGAVWGEPEYDSYLVLTCHHLRKKPVDEFTAEDLRIMIGQGLDLPFLMPRAIGLLEGEPLTRGDYYPGDLLASVIRARSFVAAFPGLAERLSDVVRRALPLLGDDQEELRRELSIYVGATGA